MDQRLSPKAELPNPELPNPELAGGTPRIFVVVVLYRQAPSASITVQTLARALEMPDAPPCTVLLYDNTPPAARVVEDPPSGFRYQAAESNRGMLGAYEAALMGAAKHDCDWILTLDQDTALPLDFFVAIAPGFAAAAQDPRIGVLAPRLVEGAQLLSPALLGIGRARVLPRGFQGIPAREARAFNSAALLRVEAIRSVGGFDPGFWLDHLDSWLHHQLYLRGWRMYVLGTLTLEHHFSLLDYANRVTSERYRNFLRAEAAFIDLYQSRFAGAAYTAQLAVRWVNQARRREAGAIRAATRRVFWQRLITGKRSRISKWRSQSGPPLLDATELS